ncbi:MAG: molybdopterin-binding protein [Deltaproteobacteria bacterium]|nr:molybdopterin-binding protein [Deltaproteobacteria bacterium]
MQLENKDLPEFVSRKIKVEDAVGTTLAHDITEIRPGEYKGPSFRKGHRVEQGDLCRLMRLGKRHLYILDLSDEQVHEDQAVLELAGALAGPGAIFGHQPREGKLELKAAYDGLLKVKVEALVEFNMLTDVMCASLHNNSPVSRGQTLAGTRAIPLVIKRESLDQALAIARGSYPLISVQSFMKVRAGLVITGSEVYDGLIEDRFEAIVEKKLASYGSTLADVAILPDDGERIAATVRDYLDSGLDMIITTGGMSVDPDDVTRYGIRQAGVEAFYYGSGVLPGAMFQLAYREDVPIVGIPACALYHEATIFDLVLPRLLAGERLGRRDLAALSHGGMCLNCPTCRFPKCTFGKAG